MEPITMTRAQYQSVYGAQPNVPAPVIPPTSLVQEPIQMTRAEYQQTYGQVPKTSIPSVYEQAKSSDITKKVSNDIQSSIQEGAQSLTASSEGKMNPIVAGVNIAKNITQAVASPITETINPILEKTGISPAINWIAQKVNDTPTMQKFTDFLSKYPNLTQGLSDFIQTGMNVAQIQGGVETAEKGIAQAKSMANPPEIPEFLQQQPKNISSPKINTQLEGVANDWRKPTEINMSSYDNARASIEKYPEIPKFLAEQGANPFQYIEDGKYNTESLANKFRNTVGKLSSDTLRPSLQQADYIVPKTSIESLNPTVDNSFGQTADFNEKVSIAIKDKLDALGRKYPNGMGLTDMLDENIVYDKNGGYRPYKPESDNINSVANRSIANSLRNSLKTNTPSDIPIGDFRAYEAKYLQAADYLDALDGKKAPVSLGQMIARNVAKYGGAKLGAMFGGEIISTFAGYQIGKALEHALENLTNPMRDTFLRNLKITNPEAFTKVSEYIGKQAAENATRPLLPSGSTNGVPNVINLNSPPDTSGIKLVPAEKGLPTANPKTGRMQKTYYSTPKK
jgi:hypothetical protein